MATQKDCQVEDCESNIGTSVLPLPRVNSNLVVTPKIKKITSEQTNFVNKPSLGNIKRRQAQEMERTVFGYELVMDLSECDLGVMSSKKKLTEYVDKLCKLIKMKKYGKVLLPYFGLEKPHTKGYSLLQFIETSSITGHFSEYWRKSYLNIFSCKPYNYKLAMRFTKNFFKAKKAKARFLVR
jgi:S-adenosylmethionine/arginine decarboxylase-like enzyme